MRRSAVPLPVPLFATLLAIAAGPLGPARLAPFAARAALASDCADTTRGFIPLNDLGTGLYQGAQGGLYPGGSNARPAAHDAAGLAIANAIVPLDTLGNPSASGKILFISIGLSNTTQEFRAFVDSANADALKNPRVQVVDCANGGQTSCLVSDPTVAYWDTVEARIRAAGASGSQVQAVWLKETCQAALFASCGTDSFPCGADIMRSTIASVIRIVKDNYPNTRLLFLSSRIYAGYATTNLNPEPWAYENGFAVKWLIEEQIGGVDSLNFDLAQGPVEAPWIAWGPYVWADGLIPRSDGLIWKCDELNPSDGTHPGPLGRAKVASMLKTFCHTDPAATPWYLIAPTGIGFDGGDGCPITDGAPGAALRLASTPNPFTSEVRFALTGGAAGAAGVPAEITVFDAAGRAVAELRAGTRGALAEPLVWSAPGAGSGIYFIRARSGRYTVTDRVVLLR